MKTFEETIAAHDVDFASRGIEKDYRRYAEMRRAILLEGRPMWSFIAVLPSDLARHGIRKWDGRFMGMQCVDSPLVAA